MTKIKRLIALLLYLQQKRRTTAEEAASHFGVSQRTIYRDMQLLHEAGLPLQAEAGVGYRLGEEKQLAPVTFSREQALALFAARTLAGHKTSDATLRHLDDALAKVKEAARSTDQELLRDLDERTLSLGRLPAERRHTAYRFLSEIQLALAAKQLLEIDYLRADGTASSRLIEPHGLFFNQQWHLVAWCRMRKGLRDFRIDRIRQLKTGGDFKPRTGLPDLQTFLEEQLAMVKLDTYVIRFKKEVALVLAETKYYFGWTHETETDDGWIEMHFRNDSVDYMGRWCMYWLPKVKPVSPPELIAFIRRQLQG